MYHRATGIDQTDLGRGQGGSRPSVPKNSYWSDRTDFGQHWSDWIAQVLVQTQIELWSDYPDWNDLWSDFPDRSYPWSDFPDQNDLWSDFPDQNVLWSDRNQTIVQTIVRLWSDPNSDHCPDYKQTMIRLSRQKWPLFRPNPDLCPDYSAPMIRPKFRPLSRL